jgi:hypothetical protein
MRTRKKVTAVGAVALASAAIGGGALFTSHAMAAGSAPPAKGTMVIVTRSAGSDEAIKCTYQDVDLPPLQPGTAHVVHGVAGAPEAGSVQVTDGPKGTGAGLRAVLVQGSAEVTAGGGDGPTFDTAGAPPDGATPPPGLVLDGQHARQGTDAECAALRPDAAPQP